MNSIKSLVTSLDKLYPTNEDSALIEEAIDEGEEEEEELEEDEQKREDQQELEEELEEDLEEDEEEEALDKPLDEKRDNDLSIRNVVIVDDDEDIEDDDDSINLLQSKSSEKGEDRVQPQPPRSWTYTIFVDWNPIVWTYLIVTFPVRYVIYLFTKRGSRHPRPSKQQTTTLLNLIPPGIITQLPDELSPNETAPPRDGKSSIDSTNTTNNNSEAEAEAEAEEDTLIRDNSEDNLTTTNIIKNKNVTTLKTTTTISNAKSRSSNKYWIPAPPRLFPISRSKSSAKRKKILILDLDETLIHSLNKLWIRSSTQSKMIEIKLNNISSLYYVHKRPFCDYFLEETLQWFELQIFTASVKEYADPIIDWLESEVLAKLKKKGVSTNNDNGEEGEEEPSKIFTKRYYRNDCTYRSGVGYIKDLSKFIKDDDLRNVMILDNSPISYALHEENALAIEGWINDQNDRDLLNLLPLLKSLSLAIDVRYILGLKNGEKFFE
ncbi:Nuclear envelope morphology protein 1 [Candida viswanathii]|uniref:Mitochondrial import inner membrane translocase subunit TIM50 n=1 Tax=Candida viswanathii TaxID=5486 RepID=A0A367Y355_9ASCO|nr:Nuclear envelope morphology protein 1 [Candida viswanathii]